MAADAVTARPAAVLFDMDGTLIETDHLYAEVGSRFVLETGGEWTDAHREASIGTSLDDFADQLQAAGAVRPREELIEHVVSGVTQAMRRSLPWRDGALELLTSVAATGVRIGLVTMAYRESAQLVLDAPGAPEFDVVVTGDDVTNGKPHPEPYLTAARLLGFDPRECVVLEDSELGLTAAGGAGMVRIAVPQATDVDGSLHEARWATLEGRTADDVFAEWRALRG
ncbi:MULTISPECIES: HAD family hydrolase [unclassified Gordonia (in: high G+C Gram-positive bacteria)]|uniref:HAD family hydrolase n=1 Tax=unclassified Gordonia (in: high G+C Gram-positive bacteria) TaxID=2657482 RepID=UPI001FFFF60C|nr:MULTISPECIES: HAD family hydrolase [unclassified Gordonia (in: high G+C Gram-positive bacteria)]UQE74930.1 HAD family hydrolase [Gordonia sp. PP30]